MVPYTSLGLSETTSIKTNRIMALRKPEISSILKDIDDYVEFATDNMEEPKCKGSEEDDNHQQE